MEIIEILTWVIEIEWIGSHRDVHVHNIRTFMYKNLRYFNISIFLIDCIF